MKIEFTRVVQVTSDECGVEIKFRPKGSDTWKDARSIRVTPHDTYIHVHLSGFGDNVVQKVDHGANNIDIITGKVKND